MKKIQVIQTRGLGDRIGGFYFGLWLAKKHGYEFRHDPIEGMNFLVDVEPAGEFDRTLLNLNPFASIAEGRESIVMVSRPVARQFFRDMVTRLGKLMEPVPGDYFQTNPEDVVVHLRLGDLFGHELWNNGRGWTPEKVKAEVDAEIAPGGNVYVVTDEPDHPLAIETIALIGGTVVGGEKMYDFRTLYHATRIANPSNSMFSESAAKLGKRVYPTDLTHHPLIYQLGSIYSQLAIGEQVFLEPIRAAVVKAVMEGNTASARAIIETAPVPESLNAARNALLQMFE